MSDIMLAVGFLEENFDDFQEWLEIELDVEGSEAEVIIGSLKGMAAVDKNDETKRICQVRHNPVFDSYDPDYPLKMLPVVQRKDFREILAKLPAINRAAAMTFISEIGRKAAVCGKEQAISDLRDLLNGQPIKFVKRAE